MPAADAQTAFAGQYPEKAVPAAPGDPEPIASSDKVITTGVIVAAPTSNTLPVFLGDSAVTTSNGLPLQPGSTVTLNLRDPSQVYCIATGAAQKLRILGV